jgi:hypothetical protein
MGTSPNQHEVRLMLDNKEMGLLAQPWGTSTTRAGWIWAADNGCFSMGKWKEERWLSWLSNDHPRSGCLFATVPDSVGDHTGTLIRWNKYFETVRQLRYPLAFVAQNGAMPNNVPWGELDCLFIGGDDWFKTAASTFALARHARSLGKWVHVGRVNSLRRLRLWRDDADSSDGTFLAYGPEKNAPRVKGWVEALRSQPSLNGGIR